jgi:electron transfer flavoprotein beta subunit
MKIVVFFKEVIDPSLDLAYGRVDEALLAKAVAYRLDPADIDCLNLALSLKAQSLECEITLVSIGDKRAEKYLREGLAVGADRAIRIWEDSFVELSSFQKAMIIAREVSLLGAELVLCGSRSLDSGSGLVGALTAARLDWPFITEVVDFGLNQNNTRVTVVRGVEKGLREKLEASLPAVLAIKPQGWNWPYPSLQKLLEGQDTRIDVLSLADLGLSPSELNNPRMRQGQLSLPRPTTKMAPLNSNLPAFDRILALLEGGLTRRRGDILKGQGAELVEQLYDLLIKEEILKPKTRP